MLISIIVPMFNEEDVIEVFFKKIFPVLDKISKKHKLKYEILCVNDGSTDNTFEELKKISLKNSKVKVISFSRNFGKEAALTAGMEYSKGDAVIPIDVDLQEPPELIDEMIKLWKNGYDVVVGIRKERKEDSLLKKWTSGFFYNFFNSISATKIPYNAGDFRLMDRKVVDVLGHLKETNRFMKGIFSWVGFKTAKIEFSRTKRIAGKTKWNYLKLINFAFDGITSFSTTPLKILSFIGFTISIFAFIYGLITIIKRLFWETTPGYPSLMAVILFLGGLQLLGIGILGEYIGRIYMETKKRPIYVVRDLLGFKNKK